MKQPVKLLGDVNTRYEYWSFIMDAYSTTVVYRYSLVDVTSFAKVYTHIECSLELCALVTTGCFSLVPAKKRFFDQLCLKV